MPVSEQAYIRNFEQEIPQMKIIHVAEPGVKFARMAAIRESGGKYIVYIDTDNEPDPDYLQQLKMLNNQYPEVAAWGPGEVTVDFLDGIEKKLESFARQFISGKTLPGNWHLTTNPFGKPVILWARVSVHLPLY